MRKTKKRKVRKIKRSTRKYGKKKGRKKKKKYTGRYKLKYDKLNGNGLTIGMITVPLSPASFKYFLPPAEVSNIFANLLSGFHAVCETKYSR